ncbi:flavohemoglobin expression-modulating QEGLA motif protein [Aquicoccus sp. G2-2]|uniref:flavohemoglobin expression-modulating QEGLA motif protein n=1 Tax=Aquicoccus sp. G2-2 TaxID=3092120 RepID=UPI002ADF9211|nr:tyrosine/phenylalanine carboxypeptidase domain-containing protein [Aquicoccus sp. G2-2]MEA1115297.1 DUF1704 domain-containing protein [Aquicoccus sp. G2-2]
MSAIHQTSDTEKVTTAIADGKSVRETLRSGGRVHVDRPLPFIVVYQEVTGLRTAAYDIVTSNASYLVTPDVARDVDVLNRIGDTMRERFGGFLIIAVCEFEQDLLLNDDSPFLPSFEVALETSPEHAAKTVMETVASAIESVAVKYRSPVIAKSVTKAGARGNYERVDKEFALLSLCFAPIYRQPHSDAAYPDLRERVVANIFDALLQGAGAFAQTTGFPVPSTHRALGRRTYLDTVKKLDRQIDNVNASFDFLMAVTPINTSAAWEDFKTNERAPELLYRPLSVDVDAQKRALHSVAFENLEDPVLNSLYRDKQQELDLQLGAIGLRDTQKFKEASRLLYRSVETGLLHLAQDILALPQPESNSAKDERMLDGQVDCHAVKDAACQMIADYHARYAGFDAEVVIRDDLPAGLMVSGPCLMISRTTRMSRSRVHALLSHEIGVHLMTYFAGEAQGLRIFCTGLAGYEGIQEGLAVFAEYLAGGLTQKRMRLLAARVVGCAAMLDGASFVDTYRLLAREYGFSDSVAFNVTVRLYRAGGFAKDAIYLRGICNVLDHISAGKPLDPYWLGKFSEAQFPMIEELIARGLLKTPPIKPAFLSGKDAQARLAAARRGLSPAELASA